MKIKYPLIPVIAILFLAINFSLSYGEISFGASKSNIKRNDQIDPLTLQEIHSINDKFINFLRDINGPTALPSWLSIPQVTSDTIEAFRRQAQPYISGHIFNTKNDYYIEYKSFRRKSFPIISGTKPNFIINVPTFDNRPVLISLLESTNLFQNNLFSLIYTKTNGSWELVEAKVAGIRVAEKSPPDLTEDAGKMIQAGHHLPAMLRLVVANSMLYPAPYIQYYDENEIVTTYNECLEIINRTKFPVEIKNGGLKVSVLRIEPFFNNNEILPLIKYVSGVPLSREELFHDEGKAITIELEKIFPGISKYSEKTFYHAYNEPPLDPSTNYRFVKYTVSNKEF